MRRGASPRHPRLNWILRASAVVLLLGAVGLVIAARVGQWVPLAKDGLHDPAGPGIKLLQQPAEALSKLPFDPAGNQINWIKALEQGLIEPRSNLLPGTQVRLLDQDLIVARNGSMPAVLFPHRAHTLWLDCSNCHEELFKSKAGANKFSMTAILNGEQCGLCHGAVAFPLTECNRCHSVPNASLPRKKSP